MSLLSLLRTPPPPHTFALGDDQLLYGRLSRRRDALAHVEKATFPAEWFHLGPVGLLQVDRQALAAALAAVLGRDEKPPSHASLVIPNSWVRSVVVDVTNLPRQRQEAEDVVRWRLKKVLPCRPEEVRLDFRVLGDSGRVLALLALDKPLANVEETFAAGGVQLGRIEPAVLAMTTMLPPGNVPALLATVEERALALALVAGGSTVVVRHKPLPADARRAEIFVVRELARTLAHAREQEKLGERVAVWVACASAEDGAAVERWAEQEAGVEVHQLAMGPGRVPRLPDVAEMRLWSLLAVAWDGAA
ncbi:MAG TPA: hypothetical protein VLW17_09605 [Thermoanaerobaculaceae bacterium]|nr:hypothetical protein [Thermoanaerobaculaceae bacterium]